MTLAIVFTLIQSLKNRYLMMIVNNERYLVHFVMLAVTDSVNIVFYYVLVTMNERMYKLCFRMVRIEL